MGITDKLQLIAEHGIKPNDVDPYYTIMGLILLVGAIFAFVMKQLMTSLIGVMLLYGSFYLIIQSYKPYIPPQDMPIAELPKKENL